MAKAVKYRGQFRSRKNILYRVDILVEGFSGAQPYTMTLPDNNPVTINWASAKKEQPVVGSELSLTVISTTDRQYIDLYNIEPGRVMARVWKEEDDMPGELRPYWQGLMDTEFYEEPYNAESNYPVALTFTDFGILDRKTYNETGRKSIGQLIRLAADEMQLEGDMDTHCVETYKYFEDSEGREQTLDVLENTYINSENFYDEDGEAMTWREVLDAVLQPLGLKITQRSTELYVFDLDGLYKNARQETIEWAADDQQMGADVVYNNIRINFSTYCNNEPLREAELSGGTSGMTKKGTCTFPVASQDLYSYFFFYEGSKEKITPTPSDNFGPYNNAFYIESHGSGEECAGVRCTTLFFEAAPTMGLFFNGHRPHRGYSNHTDYLDNPNYITNRSVAETSVAFVTNKVRINAVSGGNAKLRLELPMLIDVRTNPFEEADSLNNQTESDAIKDNSAICFVPVRISLQGDDGKSYHYHQNPGVFARSKTPIGAPAFGKWLEDNTVDEEYGSDIGDGTIQWSWNSTQGGRALCDCWMAYYADDAANNPAVGGWKTNRHNAGLSYDGMKDGNGVEYKYGKSLTKRDDGEFLPPPPVGGLLKITVYNTFFIYSANDLKGTKSPDLGRVPATWGDKNSPTWFYKSYYDKVRWHLFKTPTLKWVNAADLSELECEDVEISGVITTAAKEELSIDTKCGTLNTENPTSQACYVFADGTQMAGGRDYIFSQQFIRNVMPSEEYQYSMMFGSAEQLLINSLYSQYRDRHRTLSGTIETHLDDVDLILYRDNSPQVQDRDDYPYNRVYMEIAREEDLAADEANVTLCELTPSCYTPIN